MDFITWLDTEQNLVRYFAIDPAWSTKEVARRFQRALPGGRDSFSNVVKRDESELPPDKGFARAWEISGGNIVVNIAKARLVARERLSHLRETQLPRLKAWRRMALLLNDAASAAEAQAELDTWNDLVVSPLLNTGNLNDLKGLLATALALIPIRAPGEPP